MLTEKRFEFSVIAHRIDEHGSIVYCKSAELAIDTAIAGHDDLFNPAELLLAALAGCMIKGIEGLTPMIDFRYRSIKVHLHGVRQHVPPRISQIDYEITIDTDEADDRLDIVHDNVRKFGTVFNTLAPGTDLRGTLSRDKSKMPTGLV